MTTNYVPLLYLTQEDKTNNEALAEGVRFLSENIWENYYIPMFKDFIGLSENEYPSPEEYKKFILGVNFLIPDATVDPTFEKINNKWIETIPAVIKLMGYNEVDLKRYMKGKESRIKSLPSEMRDTTIQAYIISTWAHNKQVFRPDATFGKYLLTTKELDIKPEYFKHLPYNTFYLDLSACNEDGSFGNIHGVFVDITFTEEERVAVTMYILSNDLITYSHYMMFNLKNVEKINTDEFDATVALGTIPAVVDGQIITQKDEIINMRAISTIVLQSICYMNVKEPDIEDSPDTKNTYKPHKYSSVKNKYSELCIHDVGIRIGKTINHNIKEMNKAKELAQKEYEASSNPERKPPIPHFRSAHWHNFWCGSEKDNSRHLELRWIEPTFVCGSYDSSKTKDVVIHNMK